MTGTERVLKHGGKTVGFAVGCGCLPKLLLEGADKVGRRRKGKGVRDLRDTEHIKGQHVGGLVQLCGDNIVLGRVRSFLIEQVTEVLFAYMVHPRKLADRDYLVNILIDIQNRVIDHSVIGRGCHGDVEPRLNLTQQIQGKPVGLEQIILAAAVHEPDDLQNNLALAVQLVQRKRLKELGGVSGKEEPDTVEIPFVVVAIETLNIRKAQKNDLVWMHNHRFALVGDDTLTLGGVEEAYEIILRGDDTGMRKRIAVKRLRFCDIRRNQRQAG